MKDIKQTLENICVFEKFVISRANDILDAQEIEVAYSVDSIRYSIDSVNIFFMEKTTYEFPDDITIKITLEELEMNDSEWKEYLESIRTNVRNALQEQIEMMEKIRFESKQKEYLKLKNELGL